MSALGQKQTFAMHQPMSALPPKADIRRTREKKPSVGEPTEGEKKGNQMEEVIVWESKFTTLP